MMRPIKETIKNKIPKIMVAVKIFFSSPRLFDWKPPPSPPKALPKAVPLCCSNMQIIKSTGTAICNTNRMVLNIVIY